MISIHALREEGDRKTRIKATKREKFLSTPSARRATRERVHRPARFEISIHALREEGDMLGQVTSICTVAFLSTPSARRATIEVGNNFLPILFLSTPSARRATPPLRK